MAFGALVWLGAVSMLASLPTETDIRIARFHSSVTPQVTRSGTRTAVPPAATFSTHRTHRRPAARTAEERLAASADLLDFVESIRRNPVHGGYYLALKAYDFCTREARQTLDAWVDGGAMLNDFSLASPCRAQRNAQENLARLCSTFRHRNLADLDYYQLAEEGLRMQDERLITARRIDRLGAHWDTASRDDADARQTLIADILTSGDGWLIRDLADELEAILHSGQLMIGGFAVAPADTADAIDALRMIACEHEATCARVGEWRHLLACASAGECAAAAEVASVNALRWRNNIRAGISRSRAGINVVPSAVQRY